MSVRERLGTALRSTASAAANARVVGASELTGLREQVNSLTAQNSALQAEVSGLTQQLRTASRDILDFYRHEAPSPQTAVDIFADEWASAFPPPFENIKAGGAPLFAIEHVPWGVAALGGVEGQRVVELGPLEGGHTYMLDRMGAAEVVAIEANTRAYLKCLVVQEIIGIPSGHFLCGDAIAYLDEHLAAGGTRFDFCLASTAAGLRDLRRWRS